MKAIRIQQKGINRDFSDVSRLDTRLIGGRAITWVPEDETRSARKYIDLNGTYVSASEGFYGYSEVEVNVPQVPREPTDRCVYGYERDDNIEYMACTRNGNLMVRPFPSYVSIAPFTDAEVVANKDIHHKPYDITLMTGDGSVYMRRFKHDNEGVRPFSGFDPQSESDVMDMKQYTALHGEEIQFVGGTVELWLSEPVSLRYVNELIGSDITSTAETWISGDSTVDNLLSYGGTGGTYEDVPLMSSYQDALARFEYVRARPWRVYAKPTWLTQFSTFMGAEFNDVDYVISGRPKDEYIEAPYRQFDSRLGICYRVRVIGDVPRRYLLVPSRELDVDPWSMSGVYSIYDDAVG